MPTCRVVKVRWRDSESACASWKDIDEYKELLADHSHKLVTSVGIAVLETPESIVLLQSVSETEVHHEIAIPRELIESIEALGDVEVPPELA